MAIST